MIPESGFLGMMLGATLGVQSVLIFLVLMSLWSWTIVVHKLIVCRRAKGQVARGYETFSDAAPFIGLFGTVWGITRRPHPQVGRAS